MDEPIQASQVHCPVILDGYPFNEKFIVHFMHQSGYVRLALSMILNITCSSNRPLSLDIQWLTILEILHTGTMSVL